MMDKGVESVLLIGKTAWSRSKNGLVHQLTKKLLMLQSTKLEEPMLVITLLDYVLLMNV